MKTKEIVKTFYIVGQQDEKLIDEKIVVPADIKFYSQTKGGLDFDSYAWKYANDEAYDKYLKYSIDVAVLDEQHYKQLVGRQQFLHRFHLTLLEEKIFLVFFHQNKSIFIDEHGNISIEAIVYTKNKKGEYKKKEVDGLNTTLIELLKTRINFAKNSIFPAAEILEIFNVQGICKVETNKTSTTNKLLTNKDKLKINKTK